MNKKELIERMAGKTGLTKKDCGTALDGFLSAVTKALQAGEAVKLVGFGSFEVKRRAAKTGRNPQTKETMEIPAQTIPVFKAGKGLKDSIAD
jgi:DNA-binding protein HU-beta